MNESQLNKEILDRIYYITERIIVFDGIDDIFEHIVKTAVGLTRADASTIRLFDITTGKLAIVKGFGLSHGFLSQPPLNLGEGINGRVVTEGKPFFTEDVASVPFCARKKLVKLEGIKAVMSVPLKDRDGTIGSITVYKKKAEPFAEHDFLVLSIFASQASETVEKTRLVEELKKQALYDPLTGVYNKKALLNELGSTIKSSERYGHETGIIFIDIDDFKKFNDTHGHLLGDKLLCDFVKLLSKHCRKSDIVGKFGGEEFIIIAPHTDKNKAFEAANKLREIVSKHKFTGRDGDVHITFSAGIASVREDSMDKTELLKKADAAMYASKHKGKNCVTLWAKGM